MRLRIYLEEAPDGSWIGHGGSGELGCAWAGATRAAVLGRAPAELRRFLEWLRDHGEPRLHIPESIEPEVAETVTVGDPGAAATFAWDADPATEDDIATAVRRLGYARLDLLAAIHGLPPAALHWAPPEGLPVQGVLEEMQNFYGYCFSRLGLDWTPPPPGEIGAALAASVRALQTIPHDLRGGAAWAPDPPELWTARKVLRLLLERERSAAAAVQAAVAQWRAAAGPPAAGPGG